MSGTDSTISENALDGLTVAITGVGGFIGRRVAERVMAAGGRARGLELDRTAAARARRIGIEVVDGDVRDPAAVRAAVQGADVVVHTAAVVSEGGDPALFEAVNVHATRQVAEAAADRGARQLIHLSSVMVYGFEYPDGVDETGPLRGHGNPYCETKIRSEAAARSVSSRLDVVILRPGDVYGAGSRPWVQRPLALAERGLLVLPSRSSLINPVYVDNLVDAILLAVIQRASDVTWNVVDGEATTFVDFMGRIAAWRRGRVRVVPARLMRLAAAVEAQASRFTGRDPLVTPAALDFLLRKGRYDGTAIRRALGWCPAVHLTEGLARTEAALTDSP